MTSVRREDVIPEVITDRTSSKRYLKGRFMGKGGFAKCYELIDSVSKNVFAGKIVPKSLLIKPHQREKMTQEICIHRTLSHKHIVEFHNFFEDEDNVYVLLQLCRRRSLMELHKRRQTITEPECRYFVRQIALACDYLHKNNIIHRDLKLGNLFLNDDMEIKIGDFGLATKLDFSGERKRTLCGTPNYIAPEVLNKKGHSFEVDSWSLGCIIYTLLVGRPPFETSSLKDTYVRIKMNEYHIPSRVSESARNLIQSLLQSDPTERPTMENVLNDEFITTGLLPAGLPTSCLTTEPRYDLLKSMNTGRKPLVDVNDPTFRVQSAPAKIGEVSSKVGLSKELTTMSSVAKMESNQTVDYYLSELFALLTSVTASNPSEREEIISDDAEDPAAVPIYWVSKWVDYSDKYGLGYQLCDGSIGVLFNDNTRILLTCKSDNMQYIERDGKEHFHTFKSFPDNLTKKVTLLKYFRNYMNEHLLEAGENMIPREGEEMTRLPFLRTWYRTKSAIILHLSNGTLQINFFQDHTKVILCPLMGAVTYIDSDREARTYRLALIEKSGCSKALSSRLRFSLTMVERLLTARSGASRHKSTAPSS